MVANNRRNKKEQTNKTAHTSTSTIIHWPYTPWAIKRSQHIFWL